MTRAAIEAPDSVAFDLGAIEAVAVIDTASVSGYEAPDSLAAAPKADISGEYDVWIPSRSVYNPDPTRAVWMSALFPGLGQLYNRRFWKLPIVIGGYMGLGYATTWNTTMLTDPSTNSYMNFFPPMTQESDIDQQWLRNILQSRKNFYRRNRDLCIICMVGVYLLAMIDAYVDASLSHFDISNDLSMDVTPALMQDSRDVRPSLGLTWAINF